MRNLRMVLSLVGISIFALLVLDFGPGNWLSDVNFAQESVNYLVMGLIFFFLTVINQVRNVFVAAHLTSPDFYELDSSLQLIQYQRGISHTSLYWIDPRIIVALVS